MKTTYEQLRSAIAEKVPDIMKLEFGCNVKDEDGQPFICIGNDFFVRPTCLDQSSIGLYRIDIGQILGRDISLADVLRAMRKICPYDDSYMVGLDGGFYSSECDTDGTDQRPVFVKGKPIIWDLSKPLHLQSQEVWDFIYPLVEKK